MQLSCVYKRSKQFATAALLLLGAACSRRRLAEGLTATAHGFALQASSRTRLKERAALHKLRSRRASASAAKARAKCFPSAAALQPSVAGLGQREQDSHLRRPLRSVGSDMEGIAGAALNLKPELARSRSVRASKMRARVRRSLGVCPSASESLACARLIHLAASLSALKHASACARRSPVRARFPGVARVEDNTARIFHPLVFPIAESSALRVGEGVPLLRSSSLSYVRHP